MLNNTNFQGDNIFIVFFPSSGFCKCKYIVNYLSETNRLMQINSSNYTLNRIVDTEMAVWFGLTTSNQVNVIWSTNGVQIRIRIPV